MTRSPPSLPPAPSGRAWTRRALLAALAAAPAAAPSAAQERGPAIPLTEAVARMAERYEGRMIDARLDPRGPRERGAVYELRWLTPAGDVIRARIDARSGAMVEVDGPGQFAARRPPAR